MINNTAKVTRKLESDVKVLYEPVEGHSYSHHAFITRFRDKFYAVWSNGRKNEDDCGQRVMLAEAKDFFLWSKPRPLLDPEWTDDPFQVLTAGGFYAANGSLHVYYGRYAYHSSQVNDGERPHIDAHHTGTMTGFVSTSDGIHWSKPRSLGLPMVPNHPPHATHTGRLILSGGVMFPYSDDPSGVGEYIITGIYGDAFGDESPYDDSEAVQLVTKNRKWNANLICEGSFYETDDCVLHMMLRSNTERLWCSESRDNGETWSEPVPTDFSDDCSKFHFGRLPDGRFYYVGNPIHGGGRNPLVLCLSDDGENFDQHYIIRDEPYEKKFAGLYKGGLYGYPHTLVYDGYLYVIYSKRKECIEVTRISLEQLV